MLYQKYMTHAVLSCLAVLLLNACGSARSERAQMEKHYTHPLRYTIQAGDTLGEISQKFYGTAQKWTVIARANKLDPKRLQVGQEIIIPRSGLQASSTGKHAFQQRGKASFYAHKYQGRKTASGERYDHQRLTAAHRTLPFGTRLNVKNLKNGKFVQVVVNDRGPFVDGRIIDLSQSAARAIDLLTEGTVSVELTVIEHN